MVAKQKELVKLRENNTTISNDLVHELIGRKKKVYDANNKTSMKYEDTAEYKQLMNQLIDEEDDQGTVDYQQMNEEIKRMEDNNERIRKQQEKRINERFASMALRSQQRKEMGNVFFKENKNIKLTSDIHFNGMNCSVIEIDHENCIVTNNNNNIDLCYQIASTNSFNKHSNMYFKDRKTHELMTTSFVHYYEVKIYYEQDSSIISIGLTNNLRETQKHVGRYQGSVGIQTHNGKLFYSGQQHNFMGPCKSRGMYIIGCGFIPSKKKVFFTANGTYQGSFEVTEEQFFPIIGVTTVKKYRV